MKRQVVLYVLQRVIHTTQEIQNVLKEVFIMTNINDFLPFIIPFVIVEFILLAYVLYHIFTHDTYKRGNRVLWVIVCIVGMEFIGPVLYLILGKEDA